MKNRFFLFLATAFLMSLAAPVTAWSCGCIADPFSKKYQLFEKTWYGTKRKWTCVYTCQDAQQKRMEIVGSHSDWYMTDKGLEGICDGLHYVNTYSTFKMDFVWVFEEARWFSPAQSKAPELARWNKEHCR
ncbi:hypothetical protein EZJ49_08230 [Bdellovibrio bacteriovorus]|uniref:hypothetical protein n=1 Tax=Bdellovibrio bacteriovorus TaxID=959 RepID=UPI0021CFA866|nr:hypothetical protein [Bdellovibrio bacteriovorus]UXR66235.1 hypothetical protein EZJ49_08230 [Bdellovibrio bacteriovorus]